VTADTVWLASYPRSGSTWTRALLAALGRATADRGAAGQGGAGRGTGGHGSAFDPDPCRRHRGSRGPLDLNALGDGPIASSRTTLDAVIGFASSDLLPDEIDALRPAADAAVNRGLDRVTVRKIHDGLFSGPDGRTIVHPTTTRAAIYLVRDPRDVAVSLAVFLSRTPAWAVQWMADPDAALGNSTRDLGNQVRQRLGTWSHHVDGWTGHHLFPVEVFRYEDLHADPVGQFARLAAVAGVTVGAAEVTAGVAAVRFDRLREQEARHGFRERPYADRPFFRRGIVGAWRDELRADLVSQIERDHHATMARLGYARTTDTST
jgi:aryl sulfotransferase